jgi:signal transduction histidine kinase
VTHKRHEAERDMEVAEANLMDTLALTHDQLVSKMDSEMKVLQSEARRLGIGRRGPELRAGSRYVPDILFGRVSQAQLMAMVESLNVMTEGSIAIYSGRGEDLLCLSTNGFLPDGTSPVGLIMDPASAASRALGKGRSYWGPSQLFDDLQYTYYEPIRNAEGAMIGAFGVEYPLARLSRIYQSVHRVKILERGFLALVDQDDHPLFSGGSLSPATTRELLRDGRIDGAAWVVRRQAFSPWGLTAMAAYPAKEIDQAKWLILGGAMGIALVLVGALTLSYYYVLRKNLLRPLGDVLGILDMVSFYKQYELRFRQDQGGEIGALTDSLNGMLGQIQARDVQLLDYQEHLEELVAERLDQLVQTQLLLSATLDALPVFIAILDGAGVILVTNRHWEKETRSANPFMAGASVGTDYLALCRAVDPGRAEIERIAAQILEVLLGTRENVSLEYDVELDLRRQWFTVLATRFGTQETPRTVLMHLNVTERKMMEIQLRQAQKLESIGQLAAGIAHEINTPTQYIGDNTIFLRETFQDLWGLVEATRNLLAGAQGGVWPPELVQAAQQAMDRADLGFMEGEIPRAISESLEGVRRVSRIVSAMKDFSHPGSSSKTRTDLNRAIESTTLVCRSVWKYVAEMELDLAPALPPVPCFPDEFNQVILNLVINAAHAIGEALQTTKAEKGLIRITTRAVEGFAEIRVADTGCGIPEAIRSRIFDPFFTTKPVGTGTGQGLAITYSAIVERHGGTIDLESEVGKGTTFILRLPFGPEIP